jgi:hypothetical protein
MIHGNKNTRRTSGTDGVKKQRARTPNSGGKPKLIWMGAAYENMLKTGTTDIWTERWTKRIYQRTTGESKGRFDSYWYSPKHHFKFRSLREVEAYMKIAKETDNDEELAWLLFKERKRTNTE